MPALATWSPIDALLGVVAPLALASSVRTSLVVDLDPDGPPLPSTRTLADLVARGPTRADISPSRSGIAVLANGGIVADDCTDVISALVDGWPHVVFRTAESGSTFAGRVPVLPLLPTEIVGDYGPAVYQRVAWAGAVPTSGIALPRPSPGAVRALLAMRRPVRGPWLRRWSKVWEMPWA